MAETETDRSPKAGARRFDPATFLATAAKGRAISTHRKGTTFFAQGDATDAIFYIKKGKVKITIVSKQGKEAVVALLSADKFFGELDRSAKALGNSYCDDGLRNNAGGDVGNAKGSEPPALIFPDVSIPCFDKERPCRRRLG